ncbi:hypothetical protein [Vibrio sinaloensis]|uniref:hypothetical protein n=1 Tax=Photobacterium sp. (strain ATCC 43367) TaxID=379097 RepID=UPI001F49A808|nr:hypothetical protein [Vibrio sinaloensis]
MRQLQYCVAHPLTGRYVTYLGLEGEMRVRHILLFSFIVLSIFSGFHLALRYNYQPIEIVRITETDCSSDYNFSSVHTSVTSNFEMAEACRAKVTSTNKGYVFKPLSNCPTYTKGWEVILFSSENYFTGSKRLWIDCEPYLELPKPSRYKLSELNDLFEQQLNQLP